MKKNNNVTSMLDFIDSNFEYILLDFDGTITDADAVLADLWINLCAKWDVRLDHKIASKLIKG